MKPFATRSHNEMKDVLMDKDAHGPEIHYYMIRGGDKKTNITVWENGTIGGEYIKSYGHYHVGELAETYKVLQGEGIIILQEREVDKDGKPINDKIKSFKAVKVKTGDSVYIPPNTGHLAINTGNIWFVTSDTSPVNFEEKDPVSLPGHADYSPFKELRGAAYYVVLENGKPKLVKNPRYKEVPEASL